MKKVLLVCLMTLFCTNIWAIYDFSAENEDGVTIYYSYVNGASSGEVEVSCETDTPDSNVATASYTGNLVIPSEVKDEWGDSYTVVGLGYKAFCACNIETLSLPNTLTTIGDHAFMNLKGLEELVIPESVTSLGYYMCGCATSAAANSSVLTSVILPSGLTSIPDYAFHQCGLLENITIPEAVTEIGAYAFYGCTALTGELVISNNVISIGADAFYYCNYTKIVIGKNVQTIGDGAFSREGDMHTIYFLSATPPYWNNAIMSRDSNVMVYVPIGSVSDYQAAFKESGDNSRISGYVEFAEIDIVVADSEDDGYATFYHGTYDITLPEGVQAWYASGVKDGEVTLMAVEGGTIPAGNAVLVEGSIADYYLDATEATTTSTLEGNMLYGSDEDTTTSVNEVTDGYYFYKLSTLNGENLGFYWGEENGGAFEIAAHKAWLAVPTAEGTRALSFKKGESDTTGITTLPATSETTTVNGIYTLQGVRVSDMNQKGVYIVNGKKVLVK